MRQKKVLLERCTNDEAFVEVLHLCTFVQEEYLPQLDLQELFCGEEN